MSCLRTCTRVTRRRGAVAVLVAFLLIPMIGILGIALDGGLLLDNHRKVHGAADAAAMAAATELFVNYPAISASNYDPGNYAAAAARASSATNGFPDDGNKSNVTVNIPPKSGPFTGKVAYAEVIITYYQPRFFSRIWGTTATSVAARAVARAHWGGSGQGIVILDPAADSSLNASGTAAMTVTGGAAVVVNSNDGGAASAGGGSSITASAFEITGGYTGNLIGTKNIGAPPSPDPLSYLPTPPVPANGTITSTNIGSGNKRYVLTPGRYTNLPNFNSGDEVILKQGGIFYIDGGGFKSTGASITMDTATTGGVMIYNNPTSGALSQAVNITGNSLGTVNLSALTTGPYAGVLLWQNRTASQQISIAGGGNFTLKGTFYAANADLKVTGGGDATIGSQYISRSLTVSGNGNIKIDYTDDGTARLREAILVE